MDRCGREALLSLCGSPDFDFSKFSRFLAMVAQLSSHPWSRKGSSAEKLSLLDSSTGHNLFTFHKHND
ncbi:unnamed protein product [Urochloa humidicola]